MKLFLLAYICLLYTSDAADERSSVDLGGRRIIKKKNKSDLSGEWMQQLQKQHLRTHTEQTTNNK